jgi:hypothetical protein
MIMPASKHVGRLIVCLLVLCLLFCLTPGQALAEDRQGLLAGDHRSGRLADHAVIPRSFASAASWGIESTSPVVITG